MIPTFPLVGASPAMSPYERVQEAGSVQGAKCPAGRPSQWVYVLCFGDFASWLVERETHQDSGSASGLVHHPGLKCPSVLPPALGRTWTQPKLHVAAGTWLCMFQSHSWAPLTFGAVKLLGFTAGSPLCIHLTTTSPGDLKMPGREAPAPTL